MSATKQLLLPILPFFILSQVLVIPPGPFPLPRGGFYPGPPPPGFEDRLADRRARRIASDKSGVPLICHPDRRRRRRGEVEGAR